MEYSLGSPLELCLKVLGEEELLCTACLSPGGRAEHSRTMSKTIGSKDLLTEGRIEGLREEGKEDRED